MSRKCNCEKERASQWRGNDMMKPAEKTVGISMASS